MNTKIVFEVSKSQLVTEAPGGPMGQISFVRLIRLLKEAGEIKADETVTHLIIRPDRGLLQFRVDRIS
jgi:hypothetical protein